MSYKILKDDLKDKSSNTKTKKKSKKNKLMYLHIFLVILFFIFIFFYFSNFDDIKDFEFDFFKTKKQNVILIGKIENFTQNFVGDLTIFSTQFKLYTNSGKFFSKHEYINITNFKGKIKEINSSILIFGQAEKIKFGKNNLNLNNENFKLILEKKTIFDMFFKNINLKIIDGRIKIKNNLNFAYNLSQIYCKNFNATLSYNLNVYSFFGNLEELNFKTQNPNLSINYFSNQTN